MPGPIAGIRVVDLSAVLMGPSATQWLADMGAEVLKVEPIAGDTTRGVGPARHDAMGSNFLNMNRNKRSIALDLKHPDGRELLERMLGSADVLVHNLRPAAARRAGLDYASIGPRHPRLICCALQGFGSGGPYAEQPAYDDLIQGLAAIPDLYARATGEPRYVPTPVADRIAGLHAVIAVTAALFERERSGLGQAVEVPMFESLAHVVLADHMFGRTFEPPVGPAGYNRILSEHRHPYRTQDGWICVLIYTDRHWRAFFELVGDHSQATDPRFSTMRSRNQHIDELYALVSRHLAAQPTQHWLSAFAAADIPAAALNTLDSLIDDPHLKAVGFVEQVEHPSEGTLRSLKVPVAWSRSTTPVRRLAPNLGEHSREILAEIGCSDEKIEALLRAGVVRAALLTTPSESA